MENSSTSSVSASGHRQYLNNLPDLVYYHILKNLDLDDLWNFRLISKRFYSIIMDYHVNELSFQDHGSCYNNNNWFATTRYRRPEYQLPRFKQDLLTHPSSNLLNLKYLKIGNIRSSFRLDDLNKFTKLQVLEIVWFSLDSNNQLQLPDLKALDICLILNNLNVSLVIDAPNLHSVVIRNTKGLLDNELKFNHPLSIKYLRIQEYDKNASIFANLECLELYDILFGLESSDLLKFNNLKSLRVCDCWKYDFLLKDLFKSKKDDLELVIDGVKIKDIKKIDEYNSSRLEFQLNNYGELEDNLWFFEGVIYDELVRLLPASQPVDLFKKFTNLKKINIRSRIEDGSRLIRFIRGCSNLQSLDIDRSSLNQQFYDQLPTIKSLSVLRLYEGENLNLDFKFIIKMPYLRVLETDQDLLISSQLNLNNFKHLEEFRFAIKSKNFFISKLGIDSYMIHNFRKLGPLNDYAYVDHDELIECSNFFRCKKETGSVAEMRKFLTF